MKNDLEQKLIETRRIKLLEMPDFIADFIFSLENTKTLRTQLEYIKDISIFFTFLQTTDQFGDKNNYVDFSPSDLDQLKEKDIRNFIDYISTFKRTYKVKNVTEVTTTFSNSVQGKSRKLATLHTLFNYLLQHNLIEKDITRTVDIKVPVKKNIKNKLTSDEIELFLRTINDDVNIESNRKLKFHQKTKFRDYIITLFLAYTGIRVSELTQLDIDDINVDKGILIVTRKGGNQDKIYLPDKILSPIAEYIIERKKVKDVDSSSKNALFLSQHRKRIRDTTIRVMLEKYRQRSGITIKITPHTFRRTFGTTFYNKTGDMYLTAQQLGHTSAETTRKYYAEPSEQRKKNSMTNFDY